MGKTQKELLQEREAKSKRDNKLNQLMNSKSADQANTKKKTAAVNDSSLVRKTYYYTDDLIKAISVVAALQGKDKSQLVREILLDSDLIKEYMEKIKTL